jgi:hypothetical protein
MSRVPVVTAWVLSACTALALAGSVYRIPIQVEDLEVIVRTSESPSVGAVFVDGFHNSHTMLRPLREVQTKLLVDLGKMLGDYHLAFRGYHAAIAALLVALFTYLAHVRTWPAVAALAFALTVLTGMTTSVGLLREAYPVNHFLLIALYGLSMLAIARSGGGWIADVAAVVVFLVATFTLESGLLLLAIAAVAYAAGLRGISRWGLCGLVAVAIGYVALRTGYLGMEGAQLGDRATGFGAGELTSVEQIERFGQNPAPVYIYTIVMAVLTVVLSQPDAGQWTIVEAWQRGDIPPVLWVAVLSSAATTALIGWYLLGRSATGRRRWREPVPFVFLVLLASNAIMSYAYAKNEIVSLAGVFYALVACAAMVELLGRARTRVAALVIAVVFAGVSGAWAIRSAGLQFKLRQGAFNARAGWARVLPPDRRDTWPHDPQTMTLVLQLKQEAVMRRGIAATRLPSRYERWWGED